MMRANLKQLQSSQLAILEKWFMFLVARNRCLALLHSVSILVGT